MMFGLEGSDNHHTCDVVRERSRKSIYCSQSLNLDPCSIKLPGGGGCLFFPEVMLMKCFWIFKIITVFMT